MRETKVFTVKEPKTGTIYHMMVWKVVSFEQGETQVFYAAGYRNPEKYLFLTVLTSSPIVTYSDDWKGGYNCPAGLIRRTFQYVWDNFHNINDGDVITL